MTNCFSQPGLLPFEQAKQLINENISPVAISESITIEHANGRVLASAVISPVDVPPHNNSAMDGYAFNAHSLVEKQPLKLIGKSFAGEPFQGKVLAGECVRIMTGGKLPEGCDTVEMQENVSVEGDAITFNQAVNAGQHIRLCGEDIKKEESLMAAGHKLTATDIGTLASIGIGQVNVKKSLKVALIATGDELKQPGELLSDGDIYESNRFFLTAMLEKMHVEVIDFGVIADDKALISQAFQQANQQADVVISSGGVSVGEADYTKQVLDELGEIGFWKIAMKPGKPFAFGKFSNSIFFGLPGNPVSALVTFYQLVAPALYSLAGAQLQTRVQLNATTTTRLKKSPGRMDFQRGVWQLNEHGEVEVTSTGSQGSGILSSMAKANCFILLSQQQGAVEAGEKVTIELFDALLT